MATIDIRRTHGGNLRSTKAAVDKVAQAIAEEYGISHRWSGNSLHFDRSGVRGEITVAKDEVHVHAELGLLMGALKPLIEREIERHLDEYLV